jgi:hypothetical protein
MPKASDGSRPFRSGASRFRPTHIGKGAQHNIAVLDEDLDFQKWLLQLGMRYLTDARMQAIS